MKRKEGRFGGMEGDKDERNRDFSKDLRRKRIKGKPRTDEQMPKYH